MNHISLTDIMGQEPNLKYNVKFIFLKVLRLLDVLFMKCQLWIRWLHWSWSFFCFHVWMEIYDVTRDCRLWSPIWFCITFMRSFYKEIIFYIYFNLLTKFFIELLNNRLIRIELLRACYGLHTCLFQNIWCVYFNYRVHVHFT